MANNNSLLGNLSPISDNPWPKSFKISCLVASKAKLLENCFALLGVSNPGGKSLDIFREERRASGALTTVVVGLLIVLYFSSNFSARERLDETDECDHCIRFFAVRREAI